MFGNEKYSLRLRQKCCAVAVCGTLLLMVVFCVVFWAVFWQNIPSQNIQGKVQSPAPVANERVFSVSTQPQPHVPQHAVIDSDEVLYKRIFRNQKSANWELADEDISKLSGDILLGDILAERYLHRHYDTSQSEIILWLKNYQDYSQAPEIIELAKRKYPELAGKLPEIKKRQTLKGYGDANNDDIRFEGNSQSKKLWSYGLEAWRKGKKIESARFFSTLADKQKGLSKWQYSAASFWAYRVYLALGEKAKAANYLSQAARNPRVFYGILARKQLGHPLELDTKPIIPNPIYVNKIIRKPEIKRIVALARSGLNERAETQIRLLFSSATKKEKWVLLSLANQLNLASTQISMAKQLETDNRKLDMLKYPVPQWQPAEGFNIDPALLYALMRQESGFHTSAISSGGALGLMQLMPQTARRMQRSNSNIPSDTMLENISEPVLNITLGERYVKHLLNNNLVNGNLFYMLAAYNAGAGRLKEWQDNISYNDDPLLFVESIPYPETRYYVMQVMTNYWIYSELAEMPNESVIAVLRGDWPSYSPLITPVADAGRRRGRNG